ncbi:MULTISPECIES: hypothetical protein [unclassified Streptomyces]|uniref:hypothetical protein n=1 Tax=unclassified Streptomyces TaxID=2593676 RepID=UPI001660F4D4|nr:MULTISPECIES: hypothetical protein [unclassified Streptomyces]MBD0712175.1 hypothetical protein [Streptomyces sp. CBMA291]MBD0714007.1 hypothetical protein [Streptomyces sp. CBMA370]
MFAAVIGVVVVLAGAMLAGNVGGVADRVFARLADIMPTGSAGAGSLRFAGGVGVLVGLFWLATALF